MRLAFALVLAGSLTAHAEDKHVAATKKLLAQQVDLWRNGNGTDDIKPFAATMTSDGRLARNGDWLRPDLMLAPPYNISKLAITHTEVGWSGSWGWVTAEIKLTSRMYAEPAGAGDPNPQPEDETYHWIELVVADGDGVKGKAIGVYSAKPDKALSAYNQTAELPVIAKPSEILAAVANANDLPKKLASDAATTVLGTSDTEAAFGAAAAKKLVGGWSKLSLEVVGPPKDDHDPQFYTPVEITAGDATVVWGTLRMHLPGHPKDAYRLDAFAIARKTAGGGFELVAIAYAPD